MKTIISIKELTKTYIMGAAKVHALRGVTLDIFKNEYVEWAPQRSMPCVALHSTFSRMNMLP